MEHDNRTQYAVKVHTVAGTFALGPYRTMNEAASAADEITDGSEGYFETQRGSRVRFTQMPACIEVITFRPKDKNRV